MKQCPLCGEKRPEADVFCAKDGSELLPLAKTAGLSKSKILISLLILLITGLIVLNGFPYLLKRSVTDFRVSLLGISSENGSLSKILARQSQKILEDFLSIIPNGRKDSEKGAPRDFTILLEVENTSFFTVHVDSVTYQLFLNGRKVGKGELAENESISIGAYKKREIPCPLTLLPVSVLKSALQTVASGNIRYGVQGQVTGRFLVWQITFPFKTKALKIQL